MIQFVVFGVLFRKIEGFSWQNLHVKLIFPEEFVTKLLRRFKKFTARFTGGYTIQKFEVASSSHWL